jgi:hypothetical protein
MCAVESMPKTKKHKKGHIMPLNCQIAAIRRILRLANPDLEDERFIPYRHNERCTIDWRYEWTELLDPHLGLDEQLDLLKQDTQLTSGLVRWEVPKKPRSKLRRKYRMSKEDSELICQERFIGCHKVKAKGKQYLAGRVQISLNRFLVGKYAIVQIFVPNFHHNPENEPVFISNYFLYQHDRQWGELLENRLVRPRKRKDVITTEEGLLIRTETKTKRNNQIGIDSGLMHRYALVLLTFPKSNAVVEGMPHIEANRGIEPAFKLAELEKGKKYDIRTGMTAEQANKLRYGHKYFEL